MTAFRLDGLLRLRRLQQDQAAGQLAAANQRLAETGARTDSARIGLAETPVEVSDAASLMALAAARAAARSSLSDLSVLTAERQAETDLARRAFNEARKKTTGLEKLEDKHRVQSAAEDLRTEQNALDEIATAKVRKLDEEIA